MPYLPATAPPAIVIADSRDNAIPGSRPDRYPDITRQMRIDQAQTQQRMLELVPKIDHDPDAARQYQQLQDQNARQTQPLNNSNR